MTKILTSPTFLIFTLVIIFTFHIFAIVFDWYWRYDGIDNIYHFLGGFWSVSLFFYIFFREKPVFQISNRPKTVLLFALGFVALIGVGWEFFEFCFDQIFSGSGTVPRAQLGLQDTMSDFFFDLAGGFAPIMLFISFSRRA